MGDILHPQKMSKGSGTITRELPLVLSISHQNHQSHQDRLFTAVPASPCLMKRPELMDASTRRFVEALLSPPPRDNWSRKLKATPLRTRATEVPRSRNHQKRECLPQIRNGNAEPRLRTLADDLINLNCGTHSLGLIYEFFAKQFGEATGREEFIKYLSGEWSRDWVQAAAARVAEEQPNWSPPMPAPCVSATRTERTLVSHLREEPLLSNLHAQCIAWQSIARQPCIPECSKDMKLPALFLRAGNTRQRVGRPKTAVW